MRSKDGKVKRGNARESFIHIRETHEWVERYKAAADAAGLTVSEWIRSGLRDRAMGHKREEPFADPFADV
jgi:hypothetical protein